jgi:hypothetical protein
MIDQFLGVLHFLKFLNQAAKLSFVPGILPYIVLSASSQPPHFNFLQPNSRDDNHLVLSNGLRPSIIASHHHERLLHDCRE